MVWAFPSAVQPSSTVARSLSRFPPGSSCYHDTCQDQLAAFPVLRSTTSAQGVRYRCSFALTLLCCGSHRMPSGLPLFAIARGCSGTTSPRFFLPSRHMPGSAGCFSRAAQHHERTGRSLPLLVCLDIVVLWLPLFAIARGCSGTTCLAQWGLVGLRSASRCAPAVYWSSCTLCCLYLPVMPLGFLIASPATLHSRASGSSNRHAKK